MLLTIFAPGSRGDIQPCVSLGQGLQRAGFAVRLAAPTNFAAFVRERGLSAHPLGGDVQRIMASDAGRRFIERGGASPIASIRAMRALLGPVALRMAEDALAACHGAEALISLAVLAPFARSIAERPGVVDGRIEVREYLSVTMSFDHDIVDGAPAARFAQRWKELSERGDVLSDAGRP